MSPYWPYGPAPACAGTTACAASRTCRSWDQPRACGDDFFTHAEQEALDGPAPRAGTTRWPCPASTSAGDQARASGDDYLAVRVNGTRQGPAPRVWGRLRG